MTTHQGAATVARGDEGSGCGIPVGRTSNFFDPENARETGLPGS